MERIDDWVKSASTNVSAPARRSTRSLSVARMSGSAVTFKDAALRAVGRTVVNFQRLEHNLKIAARLGPLEGVLSKVQRDHERRTEKASSFTLGQAIEAWLTELDPLFETTG